MTIREIIRNRKGTAHSWRIETWIHSNRHTLWHYSTPMLTWEDRPDGSVTILEARLGHGSVSDQNGMNIAFRELNRPYYYSRKGGASIDLVENAAAIDRRI